MTDTMLRDHGRSTGQRSAEQQRAGQRSARHRGAAAGIRAVLRRPPVWLGIALGGLGFVDLGPFASGGP